MDNIILRQRALENFYQLRRQAGMTRWWHRLRRRPQTLLPLADIVKQLPIYQTKKQRERQSVPVCQIVGSAQRARDYDRQFRPLRDTFRDRWANMHVLNQTTGWPPVELVQVGNLYFVVDGHHRVSVARQSGIAVVEANVEAYSLPVEFNADDPLTAVLAQLQTHLSSQQTANCHPALCYTR